MDRDFKFLAFADLHIHPYKQFDDKFNRLDLFLTVLNVLFKYANKNNIDYILFAGDLFHQHKQVPTIAVNATIDRFKLLFETYPHIKFIAVSGNHDYATKHLIDSPAVTSIYPFKLLFPNNFYLIDDSSYIVNTHDTVIYGVPYYEYKEEYYQTIDNICVDKDKTNILLTHATVLGYDFVPGSIDTNHECFRKFDFCISGDIHKAKMFEPNFLMLGSPIQRDLSDYGDNKGFWMFSVDENKYFTREFKSLNSIFPIFVKKKVGSVLTEDDEKNFIIYEDNAVSANKDDIDNDSVIYESSMSKYDLVKQYFVEFGNGDDFTLNVGLDLLK